MNHERGHLAGWRNAVPLRTTSTQVAHVPVAGRYVRVEQRRQIAQGAGWRWLTWALVIPTGIAVSPWLVAGVDALTDVLLRAGVLG